MMGRTHVACGVMASLMLLTPESVSGCLCAVAGGALGGWLPDIDVRDTGRAHDAYSGAVTCLFVTLVALVTDVWWGSVAKSHLHEIGIDVLDTYQTGSALAWAMQHFGADCILGLACFILLCIAGSLTRHRTFTHSLAMLVALTLCTSVFLRPVTFAFAIGYASHILLDLLNHRGVCVLWPIGKGYSVGLVRARGICDRFLLIADTAISVSIVVWRLFGILGAVFVM